MDENNIKDGCVRLGVRMNISPKSGGDRTRLIGLASLIDDQRTSDMTLTCKDRIFHVHKTILTAHSAALSGSEADNLCDASEISEISENSDSLNVTDDEAEDTRKTSVLSEAYVISDDEDAEATEKSDKEFSTTTISTECAVRKPNINMLEVHQDAVSVFLNYLYTGQFGLVEQRVLESLLSLSSKYMIHNLKDLCEESLMENLNSCNVASSLYLGHLHDCNRLKSSALLHCKENHQNIIKVRSVTSILYKLLKMYLFLDSRIVEDIWPQNINLFEG